jgi:hypothetical protein
MAIRREAHGRRALGASGPAGAAGAAALLLAPALVLTACSGGGGSAGATAKPTSTLHDVPNGTQVKGALLGPADLPTDYTEEPSGAQNSGGTLSAAAATVNLGSADCNTILNTIGHTGFGEASYASDAYTPASNLGEFDETVLEFHGADATTFTDKLGAALNKCSSFKASDATGASENASVAMTAGPRVGDESVGFTVKVVLGGQTMVMNGAAVRVGTAVAVVTDSGLQGSADHEINLSTLTGTLVQRLRTLH